VGGWVKVEMDKNETDLTWKFWSTQERCPFFISRNMQIISLLFILVSIDTRV